MESQQLIHAIEQTPSLQAALDRILDFFSADMGTIHLLGSDGMLHLAASSGGLPEAVIDRVRVIPVGKGMAGLAVERRRPVDSCNIQSDASGDVRPGARLTGMQGAIAVPMFHEDQARGALGVASRAERTFTPEEIALLEEAGRRLAHRS